MSSLTARRARPGRSWAGERSGIVTRRPAHRDARAHDAPLRAAHARGDGPAGRPDHEPAAVGPRATSPRTRSCGWCAACRAAPRSTRTSRTSTTPSRRRAPAAPARRCWTRRPPAATCGPCASARWSSSDARTSPTGPIPSPRVASCSRWWPSTRRSTPRPCSRPCRCFRRAPTARRRAATSPPRAAPRAAGWRSPAGPSRWGRTATASPTTASGPGTPGSWRRS